MEIDIMNIRIVTLAALACACFATSVQAAESCAAKRDALEKEIHYAEQTNDASKLAGLKQALTDVQTYCSSASVQADAQKDVNKLERKVREKKGDIEEVQADLTEAKSEGNTRKMVKYERKLSEKNADLKELEEELEQARQDLQSLKQ
jgi:multidrug resistance efflux pump